jgi:hypothetical protein
LFNSYVLLAGDHVNNVSLAMWNFLILH